MTAPDDCPPPVTAQDVSNGHIEGYEDWSIGHVPELLGAATAGVSARPDQPSCRLWLSLRANDYTESKYDQKGALRFERRVPGDV